MLKGLSIAAATALTIAGSLVTNTAQARDDGAVAAGVIGGLAAGAIIGSQVNRDGYRGEVYYEGGYRRHHRCHIEHREFIDRYGRERVRRVRVCG